MVTEGICGVLYLVMFVMGGTWIYLLFVPGWAYLFYDSLKTLKQLPPEQTAKPASPAA